MQTCLGARNGIKVNKLQTSVALRYEGQRSGGTSTFRILTDSSPLSSFSELALPCSHAFESALGGWLLRGGEGVVVALGVDGGVQKWPFLARSFIHASL